MSVSLRFDGGCNNNPGEGGSGCVIWLNNQIYAKLGKYHKFTTNNEAEYFGLIIGLQYCIQHKLTDIEIYGDSLLVINQITKRWKCNADNLKPLLKQCLDLLQQLNIKSIKHIKRDQNVDADSITHIVREIKSDFQE